MRVLFVWAAAETSTVDVARGYRNALGRMDGVEVVGDFRTPARIRYHSTALANGPRPDLAEDAWLVLRLAAEGIVVEALRTRADLVLVVSGGAIHPDGLELCARAGIPVAGVLTESPYEDDDQERWAYHVGHVFTNDLWSARTRGWSYLPPAYDGLTDRPHAHDPEIACDVLIVGTGWPERQALLEAVDWSGIDLKIMGIWPDVTKGSPLWPYLDQSGAVPHEETIRRYGSAKVCINAHRGSPTALTPGPRAFEIAAAGGLQVSDHREELERIFAGSVPVYDGPERLGALVRALLGRSEDERRAMACAQRSALLAGGHTFDDRARDLVATIRNGRPVAAVS